jgi:hypothetical protein
MAKSWLIYAMHDWRVQLQAGGFEGNFRGQWLAAKGFSSIVNKTGKCALARRYWVLENTQTQEL